MKKAEPVCSAFFMPGVRAGKASLGAGSKYALHGFIV
jgi:hypothetical protein